MLRNHLFIPLFSALFNLTYSDGISQVQPSGAKPKISVNGAVCAIENQQFSCLAKTCDSIDIYQGDTVRFCTDANVDLSSDTAYYMQWDFNGSSNYPAPLSDTTPSTLPICYDPVWNSPGSYTIDVFYNGWLSAYPGSDCYSYGPSHWSIHVSVLPLSGVQGFSSLFNVSVFPNPSSSTIAVDAETEDNLVLEIRNLFGQTIVERSFRRKLEIDVSLLRKGLYFLEVKKGQMRSFRRLVIE